MSKIKTISAIVVAVTLISTHCFAQEKSKSEKLLALEKEPFAYSYHGVLVNTNMKEIELSPEYIEGALNFYIKAALRELNKDGYEQYQALIKHLKETKLSNLERIKVHTQIADSLLSKALTKRQNEEKDEFSYRLHYWQGKIAALKLNTPTAFKVSATGEELQKWANGISDQTRSIIKQLVTTKKLVAFKHLVISDYILIPIDWLFPDSTPYIRQCRDAGVPIPPAFGDPQWKYIGELSNEFISAGSRAHAYTYTSNAPEGTCIALPRISGNNIGVLGIICLGLETENACFWDKYNTPVSAIDDTIPLSEFISGTDFTGGAGNCSSCHAGENPFVIHPEANIAGNANITVDWHNPIFNPNWPRNPGPRTLNNDTSYSTVVWWNPATWGNSRETGAACTTCHKLPDVTHPVVKNEGYCGSVLALAAQRTMPPWSASTAGWGSSNNSDYRVHIEQLWDFCNQ